jgi:hypothetical protein
VLEHGRYVDLSGLVVTLELDDHLIADLDSGPLAQTLVEADQLTPGVHGDRRPELDAVHPAAHRRTGRVVTLLGVAEKLDGGPLAAFPPSTALKRSTGAILGRAELELSCNARRPRATGLSVPSRAWENARITTR